jgi:hypothetical protein
MSEPGLDWSRATVRDGKLELPLTGERPRGWSKSFARTVQLLGTGEWGNVELKKSAVRVAHVTPGTEEKLRHFLESVVVQANAAHEQAPQDGSTDRDAGDGGRPEPRSEDDAMTERFRAFARREDGQASDANHTTDRFSEPPAGTST